MNKLIIILSAIVILIIVVVGAFVFTPQTKVELKNWGPAGNFKLQDQNNSTVTLSNYTGKVLLIDFIYSHCSDLCPIETATLSNMLMKLKDANFNASQFHFLTISFDWKFDNSTRMNIYGTEHAGGQFTYWSFLGGNESEVKSVTKEYGVWGYYVNQTNTTIPLMTSYPPNNTTVDYMIHNMVLTLVDTHGVRRAIYVGPDWSNGSGFNTVFNQLKTLITSSNS